MKKIKHDISFSLATGRSRRERTWKNTTTTWGAFLTKLSQTHRTHEALADYLKMSKAQQDDIKDIGGFVGGYLQGGKRDKHTVVSRQLLALDVDDNSTDVWGAYTMLYDNAAAYYTTHKHRKGNPRIRLLVPLDREVSPEEYEAIARRIAADIDIEAFDDTTFQPSRLMYWPSTAVDGEYLFEYLDAPVLSADGVLATYRDWRDVSAWPVSSRQGEVVIREQKVQGDPLTKGGWIGAWCNTYGIGDAISVFLEGIYAPAEGMKNRYTYAKGSTAGGVVVYEDKFAYSHHSTDPAGGRLLNSFDLVRVHLHGELDDDVKESTPGNRLPSFLAMEKMAMGDPKVAGTMGAEKIRQAAQEFSAENYSPDSIDVEQDWVAKLERDKKGECLPTTMNVLLVLRNDPNLKGKFAMDKFSRREMATGHLPWRKITPSDNQLSDNDDAALRCYLEQVYRLRGRQIIADAVAVVIEENSYHPVREYLDTLLWDGKPRLDTLLIDYLGAPDTPYVRAATRKALVAAIRRINRPGYKFDTVLTLVGPQGVGKSTLVRLLGRNWFSDSLSTIAGKEAYDAIQGVWLVELGELAGLRKAEMNAIKHFLSKTEDRYRLAYGRRTENFPRQCVFFGTTNDYDFLRDPTGDRRWWPVDVGHGKPKKDIFRDLTSEEVGQVWAEAMEMESAGESTVMERELAEAAREMQHEHTEVDERTGLVEEFLNTPVPEDWDNKDIDQRRSYFLQAKEVRQKGVLLRNYVCIAEIYSELFGGYLKDLNRFNTKEYNTLLKSIAGWEPITPYRFGPYGKQRAFKRTECNNSDRYFRVENEDNSCLHEF